MIICTFAIKIKPGLCCSVDMEEELPPKPGDIISQNNFNWQISRVEKVRKGCFHVCGPDKLHHEHYNLIIIPLDQDNQELNDSELLPQENFEMEIKRINVL